MLENQIILFLHILIKYLCIYDNIFIILLFRSELTELKTRENQEMIRIHFY